MTGWLAALLLALLGLALPAAAPAQPAAAVSQPERLLVMLRLPPPRQRLSGGYAAGYADGAGQTARRRLASAIARRHGLVLDSSWPMPAIGLDCFVMRVAGPASRTLLDDLAREPQVVLVQPVQQFAGLATGPDPLAPLQPATQQWQLADLHRAATGRGVRLAIVDSQIAHGHADLAGQIALARDFTDLPVASGERHGTAVAGVIAARARNGLGIAGIAPDARVLALRACWDAGGTTMCDSFSLAKALLQAVDSGADIINLSLGGPDDPLLARILTVAMARRIWVVAARHPALPGGGFPAMLPGVLVASDALSPGRASPAVLAPGRDVMTTTPGGWGLVDGSSMAAAHVSGLLALVRQLGPAPASGPATALAIGAGRWVDGCATLRQAARACVCGCPAGARSTSP